MPIFLNNGTKYLLLKWGEMGNAKFRSQDIAVFNLVVVFAKVGIDVMDGRCCVCACREESVRINIREQRVPLIARVKMAMIVEEENQIALVFLLKRDWQFVGFSCNPNRRC